MKPLSETYSLNSPKTVFSFVREIGETANRLNHHPKVIIDGKKVTVKSITHDKGMVTKKDHRLMKEIDMKKSAAINLDISKGDILLGGRFKNKRMVVKKIETDEIGQPTVNGRKLLSVRIEKQMPVELRSSKTQAEIAKQRKAANMEKKANVVGLVEGNSDLRDVYNISFIDEVEKIAGVMKHLKGAGQTIGQLRKIISPSTAEREISKGIKRSPAAQKMRDMINRKKLYAGDV